MTVTRDQIVAETGFRIGSVLADAGIQIADSAGNLKEPIDDTFRRGYAVAIDDLATETFDDSDFDGILALTIYHALKSALVRVSTRFDLTDAGDSYRLGQVVKQIETLLKLYESDVIRIFGSIPTGVTASNGGIVVLDMDYLDTTMITTDTIG